MLAKKEEAEEDEMMTTDQEEKTVLKVDKEVAAVGQPREVLEDQIETDKKDTVESDEVELLAQA